jgi:hypothetical protein
MNNMEYSNKIRSFKSRVATIVAVTATSGVLLVSGVASADKLSTAASTTTAGSGTSSTSTSASANASAKAAANQQARLQNIINKGNQEIERRLTTLTGLTTKINGASRLNASDKATLTNEVNSTTSGLTSLKTQLDGETTLSAAITDAESIYTEYRVYALVAPKVDLVKVADDQQVVQGQLTSLSQKLQTRITAEQQAGKNVTTLQSELSDMQSKTTAAQAISSNIESSTVNLQPSDYNSNHAVLSGDNTQLITAHSDDQAAATDAKNIIASLMAM